MPILPTIDYGPLANAIGARGDAGQIRFRDRFARLQEREETRQAVYGGIVGAAQAVSTVYGFLEQARDQTEKKAAIDFQTTFHTELKESVENEETTSELDEEGKTRYLLSPKLKQMYDDEVARIRKDNAMFGRVAQNAEIQAAQTFSSASEWVDNFRLQKGLEQGELAYQGNFASAIDNAIQLGDVNVGKEVIFANGMLSPAGKDYEWKRFQDEYRIGMASRKAAEAARKEGLTAGLAVADEAYEITEETSRDILTDEGVTVESDMAPEDRTRYGAMLDEFGRLAVTKEELGKEIAAKRESREDTADAQGRLDAASARYDELNTEIEGLKAKAGPAREVRRIGTKTVTTTEKRSVGFSEREKALIRAAAAKEDANQSAIERDEGERVLAKALKDDFPPGLAVEDYLATIPEGRRQAARDYLGPRRDALMWEDFQEKMNAPGANPRTLYDRIKNDEPGKPGYTGRYKEAQFEQTRELNQLEGLLEIQKTEYGAGADKWAEQQAESWLFKVRSGSVPKEVAMKAITSELWDVNFKICSAVAAKIIEFESPAYADAIRATSAFVEEFSKSRKLSAADKAMLSTVIRDHLRESFNDRPGQTAAELTKSATKLSDAVFGKSQKFMTELAKSGWFTSSDNGPEGMGAFINALEANPEVAAAAVYTEAIFDPNSRDRTTVVRMNPYMAEKLYSLQDRGKRMIQERLGIDPADVVGTWQQDGTYDIKALPQYETQDGRKFILGTTVKDGKQTTDLTLYEITGGKRREINPAADKRLADQERKKQEAKTRAEQLAAMSNNLERYPMPKGYQGDVSLWYAQTLDEMKNYYLDYVIPKPAAPTGGDQARR